MVTQKAMQSLASNILFYFVPSSASLNLSLWFGILSVFLAQESPYFTSCSFNKFFFNEVQLIYNIVLVSDVQHSVFCGLRPIISYYMILGNSLGEGNGNPLQYSCLETPMDGGAWQAAVHGVLKSQTRLSDFIFTFHFHALEKEMATHSSVLAWRIPRMEEPGRLLSTGSYRVGHD